MRENRREIEALSQYAHEQGLVERRLAIEELFAPATLDMSKV